LTKEKEMTAEASKTARAVLPSPLNSDIVLKAYEAPASVVCSKCRRLFIFDYGGTLLQKEKFDIYIKQTLSAISGRQPTTRMMDAIRRLSSDPANALMIVTGLTKLKLGDTFKEFENVSLATSNGLVYSWGKNLMTADEWIKQLSQDSEGPDSMTFEARVEQAILEAAIARKRGNSSSNLLAAGIELDKAQAAAAGPAAIDSRQLALTHSLVGDAVNSRVWECMDFAVDWVAVRNIAVPITTRFTFRTNGTCMSPRIPGIGWSYFGADPDWGQKQSQQLRVELEAALAEHDVMVTSQIQGSIEVVPRGLHKGVIVKQFLDRVMQHRADKLPEFCTIIGDEESDDKMFEAAYELACNAPPTSSIKNMSLFKQAVGMSGALVITKYRRTSFRLFKKMSCFELEDKLQRC
jgi:trehalose-6-phosphatase